MNNFWFKEPPKCGTCRHYDQGGCKRFPPGRVIRPPPDGVGTGVDMTYWPVVRPEQDWCGEHKKR